MNQTPTGGVATLPSDVGTGVPASLRSDEARREVLHTVTRAVSQGLPLHPALRALAEEVHDRRLRAALCALAGDLERGASLHDALEERRREFPDEWRGMFAAGIQTGRVEELLGGLMIERDLGANLNRRLAMSLFYPCALLLACLVLIAVVASVVGRDFRPIFADFGIDLPWFTHRLLDAARVMADAGPWLVLGPLLAIVGFAVLYRFVLTPAARSRLLFAVPWLGWLYRYIALSEFCRVLAWLLRAEAPLPSAILLAGSASRDPTLVAASAAASEAVAQGAALDAAFTRRFPFPAGFARYMAWTATLDAPAEAVALASAIFEARARGQARLIASFMTALAIAFALCWTLVAAVLVLWPILRLLVLLTG